MTAHTTRGLRELVPLPVDRTLLTGFGQDREGEAYVTFWEKVLI